MEIIGYIGIGIFGLTILNWVDQLISPSNTVTIEELSNDVMEWFIEMYPIRKKSPRIVISDESSDYAGTYTFYNNTITLFTKNLKDYEVVINTTVHELTHWYLIRSDKMVREYDEQLEEYKYEFHPQEIWCRAVAAELTKHYIKQKI
jgi:hypothetical protein